MIRHTAPSLALGLCEPDHTAPARSKRRGAFEDQSHGRIVTRAKAYYLSVVVFLDTVLEALRDLFRATEILHLELCTKSMPGGCVDQSGVPFQ